MIRLLVSPKTWLPNSTSVTSTEICGNKNEKQKCQETSVEISQLKWKELKYFIHMMSVQRVKQNDERTASPNVPFNEGVLLIEARFLKNINTTPMKGFKTPSPLQLHKFLLTVYARFACESFHQRPLRQLVKSFRVRVGQFPNSAFAWSVAERTRYIHAYRTFLYHAWENEA